MNIYQTIINWSKNKPLFWQDAICRILQKQQMEEEDYVQLITILKKEVGLIDTQITPLIPSQENIPQSASTSNAIKLLGIHHPTNINALWENTELDFSPNGLTVVYGRNGSGKSGYAKILKKLCWSRDSNIELKRNVYNIGAQTAQSVKIMYQENGTATPFNWHEGNETIPALNTIYIFDSKCANIYLNNETPTEYKPIGLDVLERLIEICNSIHSRIDVEKGLLTAIKPILDRKYDRTGIAQWYSGIENRSITEIDQKLSIAEEQQNRYNELTSILNTTNPAETLQQLQQKTARYQAIITKLKQFENLFCADSIVNIQNIKQNYCTKKSAYEIASNSFKGDDAYNIGSDVWKQMWNYAKQYAGEESYSITDFSVDKESYCVLCHQPLNESAKQRLQRFESYIQDTSSKEYEISKQALEKQISVYSQLTTPVIARTILDEITSDFPDIEQTLQDFEQNILGNKNSVCAYLQSASEESIKNILPCIVSHEIENRNKLIENKIKDLKEVIANRTKLVEEYLSLEALISLYNKKTDILRYLDEYKKKQQYAAAIGKTDTTSISKKIGEIIESDSITLQQEEFLKHLQNLDQKIASKISITKARTSRGTTYKKCGFNDISDKVPDVLSEGEQKIVAFANFLSECTIDNATNTIVLDDPVTSLDQEYRESIANMIIDLSRNRQIIIFTHDLYFVSYLFFKHKEMLATECNIISLEANNDISGIVTDEIPYLAKNVQQRIDAIRKDLDKIKSLSPSNIEQRNYILNDVKEKMRQLIERTVEDVLIGSTVVRFKKNVTFKKQNLAHLIVTDQNDITFLTELYGKYSEVIHDGSPETITKTKTEAEIRADITNYGNWKNGFDNKVKAYKDANNIN